MADSVPSLRRKLAEANAKIAELERRGPVEVVREVVREVPVEVVRYEDRYVEVPVDREVVRVERVETVREVYVTDPAQERQIRELQEALRECQSSQSVS